MRRDWGTLAACTCQSATGSFLLSQWVWILILVQVWELSKGSDFILITLSVRPHCCPFCGYECWAASSLTACLFGSYGRGALLATSPVPCGSFRPFCELQSSGGFSGLNNASNRIGLLSSASLFLRLASARIPQAFPFSQGRLSFFQDSKSSSLPTHPWVLARVLNPISPESTTSQ